MTRTTAQSGQTAPSTTRSGRPFQDGVQKHGRMLKLSLMALSLPMSAWGQSAPTLQQYSQTNIVSDTPATASAKTYDPNSGSSWGIARSSDGPWAVANAAKGTITIYSASGAIEHDAVAVPSANPTKAPAGSPTGIVFNPSSEFKLADGKPAQFLAVTLDGLLVGWNDSVPGNTSQAILNQSGTSAFDGLGIASAKVGGVAATYLYAPDFKSAKIDVYDGNFKHVQFLEQAMAKIVDPVFKLAGLSPLNVQDIGGNLYISFAQPDAAFGNILPVVKTGSGLVVSISPEGKRLQVLQRGEFLNSPWAVALAPGNFGIYSHDLLVGNNGDGAINVFNPVTGEFINQIKDSSNTPLKISGLWGLAFGGDTAMSGHATSLYFAASAGPTFSGGLFGELLPVKNTGGSSN